MIHFFPSWLYIGFYDWWYNSLGVSMHFMHIIPDIWVYDQRDAILHWHHSILYILTSTSGYLMVILPGDEVPYIQVLYGMIFSTMIIGIILDYLILSEISDFYKRKNIQKSHNKIFAYFYVIWRVLLPDIFVASTISALGCKITLSRKNIFLLSVLAQILRLGFILVIWHFYMP